MEILNKRRSPGEIVRRKPNSGYTSSVDPELIKIPIGEEYNDTMPCWCDNRGCREWANLEIMSGPYTGEHIYHISECEMLDDHGT